LTGAHVVDTDVPPIVQRPRGDLNPEFHVFVRLSAGDVVRS
jgi:hypothetical protein